MNKKQKQVIVAIVLGIAVFFAHHYYVENEISQYRDVQMIKVVRAAKPIESGTELTSTMLDETAVPEAYAPKARIRSEQKAQYIGQKLGVDVQKGDYLLQTYFSPITTVGRKLSDQLVGADYRAITLTIDETNSFARSVMPGDKMDIVFSFSAPPARHKFSSVLLQNVPVIAVGTYSSSEQELGQGTARPKTFGTVTLRLPLADALRLNYARQEGKLNMLLRNSAGNAVNTAPPLNSVLDVLSPADREAVRQATAEQSRTAHAEDERFKDQVKTLMDQQRQQKNQARGE